MWGFVYLNKMRHFELAIISIRKFQRILIIDWATMANVVWFDAFRFFAILLNWCCKNTRYNKIIMKIQIHNIFSQKRFRVKQTRFNGHSMQNMQKTRGN